MYKVFEQHGSESIKRGLHDYAIYRVNPNSTVTGPLATVRARTWGDKAEAIAHSELQEYCVGRRS